MSLNLKITKKQYTTLDIYKIRNGNEQLTLYVTLVRPISGSNSKVHGIINPEVLGFSPTFQDRKEGIYEFEGLVLEKGNRFWQR